MKGSGMPGDAVPDIFNEAGAPDRDEFVLNQGFSREGAASAYQALCRRNRLWINGLGPSYFTALLRRLGDPARTCLSR